MSGAFDEFDLNTVLCLLYIRIDTSAEVGEMPPKFETRRFHVLSGPPSLFERVRFKVLSDRQILKPGGHAKSRQVEHSIPAWILESFSGGWMVILAEVRVDSGKFVKSTWRKVVGREAFWLVIGYNPHVVTIYKSGLGKVAMSEIIVTEGEFYDFVSKVNRDLMNEERVLPTITPLAAPVCR